MSAVATKAFFQILLLFFFCVGASAEVRPGEKMRDHSLVSQDGQPVKVSDFQGKPLVLSFVYSQCSHTCGTLTETLKAAFEGQGLARKFRSLTVGFDHLNDSPEAMKEYGLKFVDSFEGWTFASGDARTIGSLTADAGFFFRRTESGFDHPNIALVIGPDGRLFKRLHSGAIEHGELAKALEDSLDPGHEGYGARPDGLLGLLSYICYTYDEETGTYKLDFTFLMVVALGIIVQASLVGFFYYIRYSVRKRQGQGK